MHEWRIKNNERWQKVLNEFKLLTEDEAIKAYEYAMESMATLNLNAVRYLKYNQYPP